MHYMIAAQLGVFGDETAYTVTIGHPSAAFAAMGDTRPMHIRLMLSYGVATDAQPPRTCGVSSYGCGASRSIAPNAVEIDPDCARIFERLRS